MRSLSAPVSGTPFGELLLEDHHVLTGAQIRRKLEIFAKFSMTTKKQNKETFSIREKVSTLAGKLFLHRRVKSTEEPHQNKNHLLRDITSGPTVLMNSFETNENQLKCHQALRLCAAVVTMSSGGQWITQANHHPQMYINRRIVICLVCSGK